MANLEGHTAESITRLQRQLDGLRRGLERFSGRKAHDRAGLREHRVPTRTRGQDSIVCALPVLADVASGFGADWCSHGCVRVYVGARVLCVKLDWRAAGSLAP